MSTKVSKSKKSKSTAITTTDDECSKTSPKCSFKSSSKISHKEYSAYLIINDDLKMSKGKIASQCAHAILNVHRFMLSTKTRNESWEFNGEKIVALKASGVVIRQLLEEYGEPIPNSRLNVFPVYDAGRTEVEAGSLTVLATTPITNDIKPDILNMLKLL